MKEGRYIEYLVTDIIKWMIDAGISNPIDEDNKYKFKITCNDIMGDYISVYIRNNVTKKSIFMELRDEDWTYKIGDGEVKEFWMSEEFVAKIKEMLEEGKMNTQKLNEEMFKIIELALNNNLKLFGGAVRDLIILGETPRDLDFVYNNKKDLLNFIEILKPTGCSVIEGEGYGHSFLNKETDYGTIIIDVVTEKALRNTVLDFDVNYLILSKYNILSGNYLNTNKFYHNAPIHEIIKNIRNKTFITLGDKNKYRIKSKKASLISRGWKEKIETSDGF